MRNGTKAPRLAYVLKTRMATFPHTNGRNSPHPPKALGHDRLGDRGWAPTHTFSCTPQPLVGFFPFRRGVLCIRACRGPAIDVSYLLTQIPPVKSRKSPLSNFVLAGAICRIMVVWLKTKTQNPGQSKRRNPKRKRSKHLGSSHPKAHLAIAVVEEDGSPVFLARQVVLLGLVRHNKSNER